MNRYAYTLGERDDAPKFKSLYIILYHEWSWKFPNSNIALKNQIGIKSKKK